MSFEDVAVKETIEDFNPKSRTVEVTTQPRKLVGLDIVAGVIPRGYIVMCSVDANGQEISVPRDVELTEQQLAALNAAMPAILGAK